MAIILTVGSLYAADQQRIENAGGKVRRITTGMREIGKGLALLSERESVLITIIVLPDTTRFYTFGKSDIPYDFDGPQMGISCRSYDRLYLVEVNGVCFFYADSYNKRMATFHGDYLHFHAKCDLQEIPAQMIHDGIDETTVDVSGYSTEGPCVVSFDEED